MKPQSAKQKGKLLEDYVADRFVDTGLDLKARRNADSGAGNREKADIHTSLQIGERNLGIECKNQKTPKMKSWWEQTAKLEKNGYEPILIYKLDREKFLEIKVVLYLETFIELLLESKGVVDVKEVELDQRSLKYKLDRAKHAVNELIKELTT